MSKMKGYIGAWAMMALASSMMGGMYEPSMGGIKSSTSFLPKAKRRIGFYKHKGEVPKGCKIETKTIEIESVLGTIYVEIDIVFGTEKAKNKKYKKIVNELKEQVFSFNLLEDLQKEIDNSDYIKLIVKEK